jgi:hypothetical protein
MSRTAQARIATIAFAALLWSTIPAKSLFAEDKIESAGVAVGSTVGNLLFVPLKAISASVGAVTGALSLVFTGGNQELSRQIWRDTLQGPYIVTPELARKALGERPELDRK